MGTVAWFFFALNLIKLVPYAWLGLLSVERLALALMMLPLAWIGTWLGIRLLGSIDEVLFTRLVMVVLTLTGLQLILGRNITALFG